MPLGVLGASDIHCTLSAPWQGQQCESGEWILTKTVFLLFHGYDISHVVFYLFRLLRLSP